MIIMTEAFRGVEELWVVLIFNVWIGWIGLGLAERFVFLSLCK